MKSHADHDSNHDAPDSFTNLLRDAVAGEALPPADPALREAVLQRLDQPPVEPALKISMASRRRTFFQRAGIALASTAALAIAAVIWQRPIENVIGWNGPQRGNHEKVTRSITAPAETRPQATWSSRRADGIGDRIAPDVNVFEDSLKNDPQNALPIVDAFQGRMEGNPAKYGNVVQGKEGSGQGQGGPQVANGSVGGGGGNPQGNSQGQPSDDSRSRPGSTVQLPTILPLAPPEPAPKPEPAPREYDAIIAATGTASGPAKQPAEPKDNTPPVRGGRTNERDESKPRMQLDKLETATETREGLVREFELARRFKESKAEDSPVKKGEVASDPFYKRDPNKPVDEKLAQLALAPSVGELKNVVEDEGRQKTPAPLDREAKLSARASLLTRTTKQLEDLKQIQARGGEVPVEQLAKLAKDVQELAETEKRFRYIPAQQTGEQYARIIENQFLNPNSDQYALSTFSIDVDTASYANVRRFLNNGQLPPPDAVRLEELVNYFKYKYPQPKGDDPFSVNMEMADCPWQPGHKLLRVGLQGKEIHRAERPASNIVFLIDTSGSMTDQNKLPLLKQSFKLLVDELGENDKVTMVTYAGNAGLRLPPTRGHEKETINAAIDGLQSGGSTHGSAGIQLAYEVAAAQFVKGGTNKVILATDGDLNVGITDDAALVELITKKAETGVFLTVLGVGTGNLKDAKMERLADNGNGIYAYLDSVREARKVLVEEMSGSLVTIAQDVKIQLEFNPAQVQSYRLLGYENRVMANQDFRNDAKDAGEIGAGHSVTAMYEIVMAGTPEAKTPDTKTPAAEPLRYQRVPEAPKPTKELTEAGKSGELLMVRLRYKQPEAKKEDSAKEIQFPLTDKGGSFNSASKEFQFASAVVAFGLSLRNSEFRGSTNLSAVAEMAQPALGEDNGGHRAEFLDLVRRAKSLRGE